VNVVDAPTAEPLANPRSGAHQVAPADARFGPSPNWRKSFLVRAVVLALAPEPGGLVVDVERIVGGWRKAQQIAVLPVAKGNLDADRAGSLGAEMQHPIGSPGGANVVLEPTLPDRVEEGEGPHEIGLPGPVWPDHDVEPSKHERIRPGDALETLDRDGVERVDR
jgi:hypothetical protein